MAENKTKPTDASARYPGVVKGPAKMPDDTVIDGEVIAFDDDGRPSFNALQNYGSATAPVVYYAFDVMVPRAEVEGRWERVRADWPEPPSTIAPLLCAGAKAGELWAADERGVHRSDDSGKSWRRVAGYATSAQHLRGLALLP